MSSFDDMKRRADADRAFRVICGEDPKTVANADRQDQREYVAKLMRALLDRNFAPEVLIEMFIAGAAFLGDNYGVSREQIARALVALKLAEDRSLVWTPNRGGIVL